MCIRDSLRLTLHHAKPYWLWVTAVLVLQLLSTIAALWLPSLNAQIIDKGITLGDIDFIWSTGGVMLVVSFAQLISAVLAVYCGARVAMSLSLIHI